MSGVSLSPDLMKSGHYDRLFAGISSRFGGVGSDYSAYQTDPVGFAEKVLGETLTDDVKALMEAVRDYPIVIAMSANATGKTHAAARLAVWFYLCFPESQVYTTCAPPVENLERLLWGEIGGIVEKHPTLFKNHTIKSLDIGRSAQSFLAGVTLPTSGTEAQKEAKFSGKHAPHIFFEMDEGDGISDAAYRGAESCMSGGHARMLVMFNPRSEQGWVHRAIRDGRAKVVSLSAFNHPNVITGTDKIPGAVNRPTTVRRICEWCRHLALNEKIDSGCFELPTYLEGEVGKGQNGEPYPALRGGWYRITDPAFSYMVLGRFPGQGSNQLINKEWINRARSRWDVYVAQYGETPPGLTRPVAGLDVAEFGSDANAMIFRSGGFVSRPLTWGGMDLSETAIQAAAHAKERSASRVFVDSIGVGAAMPGMVSAAGVAAVGVKSSEKATVKTELGEFSRMRDQLWWSVREWLRVDLGAMLPPDETLLEELTVMNYEIKDGRIKVMGKDNIRELLGRSCDRADSLCLTFSPSGFFGGCSFQTI